MSIVFSQVSKRYSGGFEALSNVSFEIQRQQMVFITGHSGAGKSTLLKLISIIEQPTRGQILINDKNTRAIKDRDIPYYRRNIGVVFQDHQLLDDRTVFDNTALPLIVAGTHHHEIKKRVQAALDKVGLLKKQNHYPRMLSGGEQQRVGIARAVVSKPTILLADEPTGNLDNSLSDEITDLFSEFNRVGVTVLIATHDHRQRQRHPCPVLELGNGQISGFYQANDYPTGQATKTSSAIEPANLSTRVAPQL